MEVESGKLELALDSILSTWQQGRRALVVIGAGASVSVGVPNMAAVFRELKRGVEELNGRFERGDGYPEAENAKAEKPQIARSLRQLCEWLTALVDSNAPRSVAAMTLGTLQRSHLRIAEQEGQKWFNRELSHIWTSFSKRFVSGELPGITETKVGLNEIGRDSVTKTQKRLAEHLLGHRIKQTQHFPKSSPKCAGPIPLRDPSHIHHCVASWALQGWADIVSLNFDGLSREALKRCSNSDVVPVVLTEPRALQNYFLGNPIDLNARKRIVPIVKIWGDVFHAVCTSQQCPEFGNRIPIYELDASKFQEGCSSCHAPRQLQIFFTGYEEKEKTTDDLMRELLKYVAPRIGCIVTIGFSGLWDQTLVKMLVTICRDLNCEDDHSGRSGQKKRVSWICVDPDEDPPLLQDLTAYGIAPTHLPLTADDFASIFDLSETETTKPLEPDIETYSGVGCLQDGKWHEMVKNQLDIFPKAYKCFMDNRDYLHNFKYLRQLGIKTRIALARNKPSNQNAIESDHNRQKHSWGAATLSALWFRALASSELSPRETERLGTVVVFAAMHHDIGHLPFTHLAEEIFQEVHWSLEDWADAFRHEEHVLGNCIDRFREEIEKTTNEAATLIHCRPEEFLSWVEGAIHGRSGYPWIDAILNSPLDVDKLDYVFRDCDFLGQGIHISEARRDEWIRNLFKHTRVLPSGLVALEGEAGEQARDFLEERRWLYKHQYYQPGYRALERLARAVTLQWLLHMVPDEIVASQWYKKELPQKLTQVVADTSARKGIVARERLWKELIKVETEPAFSRKGEPGLLLHLTDELTRCPERGLPPNSRVVDWAKRCMEIFTRAFDEGQEQSDLGLLHFLTQSAGMTCSETIYISFDHLKQVREIVRELETLRPFRALFDIAVMPRMLSYPSRRRLKWGKDSVLGECFAVAHRDPDRWGMPTSHWIPMSESAVAERDKGRWAKVMVVSQEPNDPEVLHALDKFRTACRHKNIRIADVDPDEPVC